MTKALTLIKDYMGDYKVLDDSRLPKLRQMLIDVKAARTEASEFIVLTENQIIEISKEIAKLEDLPEIIRRSYNIRLIICSNKLFKHSVLSVYESRKETFGYLSK